MFRLEELANVALRVPSILVLDLLYKCDIEGLTENIKAKNEDMLFKYKYVMWNLYYLGKSACDCVPRRTSLQCTHSRHLFCLVSTELFLHIMRNTSVSILIHAFQKL